MTTELTVQNGAVPAVSWTNDQVDLIKRTIAVGATHDELQLFLYQAKRTGLDPLSRQIHFVKRKDKGTIQTAIDGYRLIADRTGKYAGNDDYRFDEGVSQYEHMAADRGNPWTATATVYKMVDGVRTPFTATAAWNEYFPGEAQGFMWKKMPYLMIGKCAEALALRKAFPAELSGVYTNEEMMQADAETPRESRPATQPSAVLAPNYGPYAKQPLSEIPTEDLRSYLNGVERSIADPAKARFKQANMKMRDAIGEEIGRRSQPVEPDVEGAADGSSSSFQDPSNQPITQDAAPALQLTAGNIIQQFRLCESISEAAHIMNQWQAEAEQHSQEDREKVSAVFTETRKRLGKK